MGVNIRAWTAPEIERIAGASNAGTAVQNSWKAQSGPTIFVTGGPAFVRAVDTSDQTSASELLVPVGFRTGSDPQRPYEARIRLEYAW